MESQIISTPRKTRRSGMATVRQVEHVRGSQRPFARLRSGRPTGTTPWFKLWMADVNIKRMLQVMKLTDIAAKHTDPILINCYTLLASGGFKTVWDLTQASKRDVLAVKGVGTVKAEHVKADLSARNVAVRW